MAPVPAPVGGAIPMTAIKFGTDGWRGVIDEDFTEASAASILAVSSGEIEPPKGAFSLMPLKRAGLWLAVITSPPAAPWWTTENETSGVGTGRSARRVRQPLAARMSAASSATAREFRRVS